MKPLIALALAVTGLSGCAAERIDHSDRPMLPWELLALLGVGLAVFLALSGVLAFLSRSRRRRKVTKILVAVLAGLACGALWVLLLDSVVNAARPGAMRGPAGQVVAAVTALTVSILLLGPGRLRQVVGRSALVTGFHSLALPIAALTSFVIGGALSLPGSAGLELSAVVLGVRLAGSLATIGLSVGGFVLGFFLVSVGDRALRRARSGRTGVPRVRFDLGRYRD